ncbi:MAG: hypothetical protein MJ032_02690, partial [Acidaminococcaceae bacterium]|nr:hypothetical protein [Acidaminococcaceae bacterium]
CHKRRAFMTEGVVLYGCGRKCNGFCICGVFCVIIKKIFRSEWVKDFNYEKVFLVLYDNAGDVVCVCQP